MTQPKTRCAATDSEPTPVTEYALLPRQWRVVNRPRIGEVMYAMMPYPDMSEERPCYDDPAWTDDDTYQTNAHGRPERIAYMRSLCASCPVQAACAEWGIAHEEHYMFGGLLPTERAQIRRFRRQGLIEPQNAHQYGFNDDYFGFLHNPVSRAEVNDAAS